MATLQLLAVLYKLLLSIKHFYGYLRGKLKILDKVPNSYWDFSFT